MAALALIVSALLVVVLVAREITLRLRIAALEHEIDRLRAEARDSEQLATMGQLVSGLAQELKSPLQGVIGNTELIMASGAEPGGEELRNIQENATRAVGLVRNLLAFTETTALNRRWQDMNDIVRRAVEYSRSELIALGVRTTVNPGERVPLVYVDGRQLEKVVSTLLSRHTPRNGVRDKAVIAIATYRRATGGSSDQDDRLVIEINDRSATDIGDELSWSGDLAAARQIIEAHGGSLDIVRPVGGGCLFHLELPLTASVLNQSTGSERHG